MRVWVRGMTLPTSTWWDGPVHLLRLGWMFCRNMVTGARIEGWQHGSSQAWAAGVGSWCRNDVKMGPAGCCYRNWTRVAFGTDKKQPLLAQPSINLLKVCPSLAYSLLLSSQRLHAGGQGYQVPILPRLCGGLPRVGEVGCAWTGCDRGRARGKEGAGYDRARQGAG